MAHSSSPVVIGRRPHCSLRWQRIVGIAVVLLLLGVFVQRQDITDWIKLRSYSPPAAIAQLADQTTMTASARQLFYLNHPSLQNKTAFAKACPKDSEQTIVLGCYISGQAGIHILSINDRRLNGVEQVTAAHEMLHAAYERLSASDKKRVDGLLQDYFAHQLTDQRIKATLKAYETSEPGQQLNEMHSIFGTEIPNLSGPLEQYYRRYFQNRSIVADDASRYQAAFTSRKQAVARADAQLASWHQDIEQQQADLEAQNNDLQTMDERLEREKADDNIAAYNTDVSLYNARVAAYNADVASLKNLITRYNQLVDERNAIALQAQELQHSLDGDVPSTK